MSKPKNPTNNAPTMVSLAALTVLPEQFQTRAELNQDRVRRYARNYAGGHFMDPILVVELPDGRLVVAGGFHRVAAVESLRRSHGMTAINATIRQGTEQDAILWGVRDNIERADTYAVSEADRRHSACQMIRNRGEHGTWDWSDNAIASECGTTPRSVKRWRLELLSSEGLQLPDRVKRIEGGVWTGKTTTYKRRAPNVTRGSSDGRFVASMDGRKVALGANADKAAERLKSILESRDRMRSLLADSVRFAGFLLSAGIHAPPTAPWLKSYQAGSCVAIPIAEPSNATIAEALGRSCIARQFSPEINRTIFVGYFSSLKGNHYSMRSHVAELFGVEFKSPEEFLAEFAPGHAADEDDGDPMAVAS